MTLIGRTVWTTSGGMLRKGVVVKHQKKTEIFPEVVMLTINGQSECIAGSLIQKDRDAAIAACVAEKIYWSVMQTELLEEAANA